MPLLKDNLSASLVQEYMALSTVEHSAAYLATLGITHADELPAAVPLLELPGSSPRGLCSARQVSSLLTPTLQAQAKTQLGNGTYRVGSLSHRNDSITDLRLMACWLLLEQVQHTVSSCCTPR